MSCVKFDTTAYSFDSDQLTFDDVCVKDIDALLESGSNLSINLATLRELQALLQGSGGITGKSVLIKRTASNMAGNGYLVIDGIVISIDPETIPRESLSDKWFDYTLYANSLIVKEVLFEKNTVTLSKYLDSIIR